MTSKELVRLDLSARKLTIIDGDQTAQWRVDQVRKPGKAYGRAWGLLFLEAARMLAAVPLSPTTTRVLFWCLGNCHPVDWTLARHVVIAQAVGVGRPAVTKSLGELLALGLIEAGPNSTVRLSLFVGWQGTSDAYQKARRSRQASIDKCREIAKVRGVALGPEAAFRLGDNGALPDGKRERAARRASASSAVPEDQSIGAALRNLGLAGGFIDE